MKLSEFLYEDTPTFVVYKVSSPNTDKVYYGYSQDEDVKKNFFSHADEGDPDRGDVRMIYAAGGKENLEFSVVDVAMDEQEAFEKRNTERDHDAMSITPSSQFPGRLYRRTQETNPALIAQWKSLAQLKKMTGRQAMSHPDSGYKHADLQKLVATDPLKRASMMQDLDALSHSAFKAKYFGQA